MTTKGKNYKLNCLIEGEEDTLTFFIPCDAEVKELKQVIHREGGLDVSQHRPLDLALWKVYQELFHMRSIACLTHLHYRLI